MKNQKHEKEKQENMKHAKSSKSSYVLGFTHRILADFQGLSSFGKVSFPKENQQPNLGSHGFFLEKKVSIFVVREQKHTHILQMKIDDTYFC